MCSVREFVLYWKVIILCSNLSSVKIFGCVRATAAADVFIKTLDVLLMWIGNMCSCSGRGYECNFIGR